MFKTIQYFNSSYTYGIRKDRWIHTGLEQMEHWEEIRKGKQLRGHTDRWRSSLRMLGFVLLFQVH